MCLCYMVQAQFVLASTLSSTTNPIIWQGVALGAGAEIRLYTDDEALAQRVINQAQLEISRLEKIFSLYQPDSTLVRLNKQGKLEAPPLELIVVLGQVKYIHQLTRGKFDPTIQRLWNLYAEQVKSETGLMTPPSPTAVQEALKWVDFSAVEFNEQHIRYQKPGMLMSLNGIAQGYITDKVMELIQASGIRRALIDIGEIKAIDLDKIGEWQVGIKNPKVQEGIFFKVPLQNGAISTSGGYGTLFDKQGRFTHLFNPKTGNNQERYQSVSVQAPTAALADALSTAFAVSSLEEIKQVLVQLPNIQVWVVDGKGKLIYH